MGFTIRMGIPEMLALWTELQKKYRDGTIKKKDEELYKKWGNALKKLSADPFYPGCRLMRFRRCQSGMVSKSGNHILKIKTVEPGECIGCMDLVSRKLPL